MSIISLTAKAGTGIAAMSVMRPELIMKSIIPVVMAGKYKTRTIVTSRTVRSDVVAHYKPEFLEPGVDTQRHYASVLIVIKMTM